MRAVGLGLRPDQRTGSLTLDSEASRGALAPVLSVGCKSGIKLRVAGFDANCMNSRHLRLEARCLEH